MQGWLAVLAWSSDVFVDGSAAVAKALGISPFIIGMVIIGFGTGAPELCVSTMSGLVTAISTLVPGPNGEPAFRTTS